MFITENMYVIETIIDSLFSINFCVVKNMYCSEINFELLIDMKNICCFEINFWDIDYMKNICAVLKINFWIID